MTTGIQDGPSTPGGVAALAGKYLTFALERESYGIPVLRVREIIQMTDITAMPQMPPHIRGVINLRGKIIPVIDLRLRFGFAQGVATGRNCIVVVQVRTRSGETTPMGLVVDGVEEVAQIAAADIEETPDFGTRVCTAYLLGMAKVKGVVKALLDIDKAIDGDAIPLGGRASMVPA